MANMSSAVIRQITNGWVVTYYIPATATEGAQEFEQYYADLTSATAGMAVTL